MEDDDDMDTSNGTANGSSQGFSVRRPKDYIVPSIVEDEEYQEGVVSPVVPDTPNKISVANLLVSLTDDQVIELLVAFGQLKAFVLVKDASTEESRGIAFCEYLDPASTDIAGTSFPNHTHPFCTFMGFLSLLYAPKIYVEPDHRPQTKVLTPNW